MASTSSPPNRSPTTHHSELNPGDELQSGSTHDGTYSSSRSLSNLQAHVQDSDHSHNPAASHIHQHHLPPLPQHHPHQHHPHPHPHHPHHPHHHHLHLLSRSESPYTNNNSLAASARTSMTRVDLEDQITAQLNQTRHMDSHDHERAPHTLSPSDAGLDTQQHMMDQDYHDAGIGAAGAVGSSSVVAGSGGEGVQDGTRSVWEEAQGSSSYPATSATMLPTSAQESSSSPSALPQQQQQQPTPPSPSTSAAAATSSQPQTQPQAQTNPGTVAPAPSSSQFPPEASHSQSDQPESSHDHHPPAHPPTPKVFLTFLLLSGQRRLMSFEPQMTVGRVKELVWNGWNSDWQGDARPHTPSYIRMIYQGKILQDDDTLLRLNLPTHPSNLPPPTGTIVHLSIRPSPPPGGEEIDKPTGWGRIRGRSRGTVGSESEFEEDGEREACCRCVIC